ncbi:GMC oxidoreductase [Venustampulla echinocandica]|uniref:GMC oxidoreductase n=1 Tax=Venustampulla echinocandica TaxID=2656787 RepID=A0A370TY92_9HELO|nr:GMC oxidoreductase [Venustampulla echinocandica]RDL40480.1 GMC oxidoreductase [Venustampulla echinocandica]
MGKLWRLTFLALLSVVTATGAGKDTYDYIVVGSGPGGGTLAANLAKAGESVLLLEAGDDQGENPAEKVAGLFPLAGGDPLMRWDFFVKYHSDDAITRRYEHLTWRTTDGQFYVGTSPPAGATQLGVYYPRAGTLGGCSTHNAMCATLPSNSEWQHIADITGDDSWSAKNMRKHFINLENDHLVPKGTPGHGFNGFLDISVNTDEFLQNQTEAIEVLKATAKIMGQDPNKVFQHLQRDMNSDDPDRDQQTGLFGFPAHRDLVGNRVSARDAVVQVANAQGPRGSKKYALTVGVNSFVTKVLFDKPKSNRDDPRATGVEYIAGQSVYSADPRYNSSSQGTKKQAFARKEVIVSGGTFNSPQILMLSGIGPKADLTKLNIPVVVDLPGVGTNLQDNTEFGVAAGASLNFTSKGPVCTYGAPGDPCLAAWHQGKGPYAQGPLAALLATSSVAVNNERDLFYMVFPGGTFRGYWPGTTVNQVPGDAPNTFDFSLVKMGSKGNLGTLKLVSNDPRDTPEINFRFFEGGGQVDLQAIEDGVTLGRKIYDSVPGPVGPFTKEVLPCTGARNCDVQDEIKTQAWSHHATSTCAIGADSDPKAVLDSKFRVRGTRGLRVVDASAFPKTPGAFPVVPTFMLGMKASEVILQDSKKW